LKKEFALYKGDNLLIMGTIEEIAKKQNIKESTVSFYKTPTYKNRIAKSKNAKILIALD